jgi:hypothetical protein
MDPSVAGYSQFDNSRFTATKLVLGLVDALAFLAHRR